MTRDEETGEAAKADYQALVCIRRSSERRLLVSYDQRWGPDWEGTKEGQKRGHLLLIPLTRW